ncbi:hypothetical protein H8959_002912 [Pygathrix nigripes]
MSGNGLCTLLSITILSPCVLVPLSALKHCTFLQSLYRKSQPIKMSSILTSLDGSPAFTPAPVRISPTRGHRRVLWHHPIRERLPAFSTGLLSTSGEKEKSKEIYQDLVFFP